MGSFRRYQPEFAHPLPFVLIELVDRKNRSNPLQLISLSPPQVAFTERPHRRGTHTLTRWRHGGRQRRRNARPSLRRAGGAPPGSGTARLELAHAQQQLVQVKAEVGGPCRRNATMTDGGDEGGDVELATHVWWTAGVSPYEDSRCGD